MDINVFAKFDEIHHCLFKILKKNQNAIDKELQRAKNLTELAPSIYFSIINVYLVDINVFAKFYEILSLPFQNIEKPKCHRRKNRRTDVKTVYFPTNTNTVCGRGGYIYPFIQLHTWVNSCKSSIQHFKLQLPWQQIKPEDHWSCIVHLIAEDMLKSAVTEEKTFKHSPWAGADNPLGPKFWCQQVGLINMVICCKFTKNPFNLWLYTHLFMIK